MESSQVSLLTQAKQGDPKAISALLNHKLQSKGITVRASVKNSCLHIMLEAAKTPAQQPLVDFLYKSLSSFVVDAWHTVKVYGRRVGEEIPDWAEEFKVGLESSQHLATLAKQGDVKAIAMLLNQKLQPIGVEVKVSLKDACLQVMIEATEAPAQERMVSLLQFEIQKLEVQGINKLRLYGKQSGEDFPDWQEEVNLLADENDSEEAMASSLVLSSSKIVMQASPLSVSEEVDGIELSNRLYAALGTTCYQHLTHKVGSEDGRTIHEIVENFVDGLESDLDLDLDQFAKQVVSTVESSELQLEQSRIQVLVSDVAAANFAGVRLAIRDLERVTREVLQTDFPQESNALKAFFTGAAQEFTANLSGRTVMSQEAMIGATIGLVAGPLGSVVGGAIGGWIGGNKQQKVLEALLERYQKARVNLFQEWETLLKSVYNEINSYLASLTSVKFLTHEEIEQAIDLCNEGHGYLEKDLEKAIELFDNAIQLNPRLALAWNNKGYALNQLRRYEEALPALIQAVQFDRTLVLAFINCGTTLRGLGRSEEAIPAYEESIRLEPENYSAWVGIWSCLYNLQQFEKAIEVAGKLIDLKPEVYSGWYLKACCQSRVGYSQQALENLKEAIRLNPEASQRYAKTESDFARLREDEQFKALMESCVGVSYRMLKGYLKQQQWREADQETARLMREVIQKTTNSTDITPERLNVFPCTDLETIDLLWRESSEGRFSFSVQKELYQECHTDKDIFGSKNGWRVKDANGNWSWRSNANFDYNPETIPVGHLPSGLWAGEDGWFGNRRDRLIALFTRMDSCSSKQA